MHQLLYAPPRHVASLADCYFYHTMDVPGYGLQTGQWDLRPGIDRYLGGVSFHGKRVLEVGTASGFVCLHMERLGAEVVAFDLSDNESADIVPYARHDWRRRVFEARDFMRRINNSFWLNHRVHQSRAKAVYGTVYSIPAEIGLVDVSVFGAILLHLRDPFLALENAARLTRKTMIVAELDWSGGWRGRLRSWLAPKRLNASQVFLPDAATGQPTTTWWQLSSGLVQKYLAVLGFEDSAVTYHHQTQEGVGNVPFFTVVAQRTVPDHPVAV